MLDRSRISETFSSDKNPTAKEFTPPFLNIEKRLSGYQEVPACR
jgi:hypothetical protein